MNSIANFRDNDRLPLSAAIIFINSSSGMYSILFEIEGYGACRASENSKLWIKECIIEIMYPDALSGFICSGKTKRVVLFSSVSYSYDHAPFWRVPYPGRISFVFASFLACVCLYSIIFLFNVVVICRDFNLFL